ncbi:hypothetical protein EVAR_49814_1 [Eumeta japonica]|uniref:Uncharacterized protein n=1 Tax=Eumeta variegata TaxID=151549 RepID=A0A4C1XM88_EUMVA|nr:hypothetical protein EVAR_49814_1 [Eumeta japonica]
MLEEEDTRRIAVLGPEYAQNPSTGYSIFYMEACGAQVRKPSPIEGPEMPLSAINLNRGDWRLRLSLYTTTLTLHTTLMNINA